MYHIYVFRIDRNKNRMATNNVLPSTTKNKSTLDTIMVHYSMLLTNIQKTDGEIWLLIAIEASLVSII